MYIYICIYLSVYIFLHFFCIYIYIKETIHIYIYIYIIIFARIKNFCLVSLARTGHSNQSIEPVIRTSHSNHTLLQMSSGRLETPSSMLTALKDLFRPRDTTGGHGRSRMPREAMGGHARPPRGHGRPPGGHTQRPFHAQRFDAVSRSSPLPTPPGPLKLRFFGESNLYQYV